MANVSVKLFGVLRVSSHISSEEMHAEKIEEVLEILNSRFLNEYDENRINNPRLKIPKRISIDDVAVYINGHKTDNKKKVLCDGDEVWLMSPVAVF